MSLPPPSPASTEPLGIAPDIAKPARPPLAVPGLTLSRALVYLPGREQIFERVLRQFASQYRQALDGLAGEVEAGDWPAAMALVHPLRGACGAIGATDLLAQAGALELALQQRIQAAAFGAGGPINSAPPAPAAQDLLAATAALVASIDLQMARQDAQPGP